MELQAKEHPTISFSGFVDSIVPVPEALVRLSLPLPLEIIVTDSSKLTIGGPSRSDRGSLGGIKGTAIKYASCREFGDL